MPLKINIDTILDGLFDSIVVFLTGIFLFIMGFVWLKKKRLIENIPTSKIRGLAMGLVEVYGEVIPAKGKILKSPLSNEDCVLYKYIVREYKPNIFQDDNWKILELGGNGFYFYLRDDTGIVLIEPANAKIELTPKINSRLKSQKDWQAFMEKIPKETRINFQKYTDRKREIWLEEYFISPKDKLHIMGTASLNPFVARGTATEGTQNIVIQKGQHDKIYYISDKPEKIILKTLKWKIIGGLFGGIVLTLGSLAYIFIKLGIF